jgi:sugar lactone lactonase YvrE
MRKLSAPLTLAVALTVALVASVSAPAAPSTGMLLASGLEGGSGSTVGPDGALYLTESLTGSVARVDPATGAKTTFATGLPPQLPWVGLGGAMDVAFIGNTLYALVTVVGPDVGGSDIVGIYRMDSPTSFTPIADIGQFAVDHKPNADIFVATGVQYSLEQFRGGFLVTDGHHNRVYRVTRDGNVTETIALGNVVPTGLSVQGNTVYMAEAGPLPHSPSDGKVVSFTPGANGVTTVAAGAPLLVDVERGRGESLFALAQGHHTGDVPGTPADPNTGSLVRVNADGTFTSIATALDRPTSLELIGTSAYVVTITGEIWKIDVSGPPYGKAH